MHTNRTPLKVKGIFEAIVESNTRIAPATFHVIKGHTNTDHEPLIGFQTTEDLGLVKVANTVQSEETITSNLLQEYADLFHALLVSRYRKDERSEGRFAR